MKEIKAMRSTIGEDIKEDYNETAESRSNPSNLAIAKIEKNVNSKLSGYTKQYVNHDISQVNRNINIRRESQKSEGRDLIKQVYDNSDISPHLDVSTRGSLMKI